MQSGLGSTRDVRGDDKALLVAEHVISTQQAGTTILLDVKSGKYYTLNEVGGRIWELLCEGTPMSEITERLTGDFEVSAEQLRDDANHFLEQLRRWRLISA